ncbi:hypothetical protein [Paracidovorax oryzae]|uniref:hypothetical protein n=1 Tax=Paracidovorax oryzae TaxID=862720 RepID=UPI00178C44FC|nr:hypothetical protein [Paracidovorax oryzae]
MLGLKNLGSQSIQVTYRDGFIARNNGVVLCSKLDGLDHDNHFHGRRFTWVNGDWGHSDIPFTVCSAVLTRPAGGNPSYLFNSLGLMSGAVEVCWPMAAKKEYEFLPGASQQRGLPHLQQIKEIEGRLYVVGPNSQIFRRKLSESGQPISFAGAQGKMFSGKLDQWEIFNQGVEARSLEEFEAEGLSRGDAMGAFLRYCSLNSIDGFGTQLYAVGDDGVIIHKQEEKWKFLPKATNAELRRVKQVDAEIVFVVGDKGTLLSGNAAKGFKIIPTNMSEQLRALEWFNGKLYIGSIGGGVFVYDGKSIAKVPQLPDFECLALHANDGQLLAVGNKEVFLTGDGIQWRSLQNPDNM